MSNESKESPLKQILTLKETQAQKDVKLAENCFNVELCSNGHATAVPAEKRLNLRGILTSYSLWFEISIQSL